MSGFKSVRYTGSGHKGMKDDEVHIEGGSIAGFETLCGNCDTFMPMEETDQPVNCAACIEIYQKCRGAKGIKIAKKSGRR